MPNEHVPSLIEELVKALKKNEGLYYAYQANIAVQFQDEVCRSEKEVVDDQGVKQYLLNFEDIHKISNEAAKNFLNLLIADKADEIEVVDKGTDKIIIPKGGPTTHGSCY